MNTAVLGMEKGALSRAMSNVDEHERAAQVNRIVLSVIEDTAHFVAKVTRGQTAATPERRKLREDMERAAADFIRATTSGEAARSYALPEETVTAMLAQSLIAETTETTNGE